MDALPVLEAGKTTKADVDEILKVVDRARSHIAQTKFLAKTFRQMAEDVEKGATSIEKVFEAWFAADCGASVKIPAWFWNESPTDRAFWTDYMERILQKADNR